jgi:lantibiotic modifying enzyme
VPHNHRCIGQILEQGRLLKQDATARPGERRSLTESVATAAWDLRLPTLPDAAAGSVVQDAFIQLLNHCLQRTSRAVFDHVNIGCNPRGGPEMEAVSDLPSILNEYRGLARLWELQIRGWMGFVDRFLAHATLFAKSRGLTPDLIEVRPGLSDPHHQGKSVVRVKLNDNTEWYYKPRAGYPEAIWNVVLETLNAAGMSPALRTSDVQDVGGHCWLAAIPQSGCDEVRARQRFDQRVGAILYLAHQLRAVDLHPHNFVSSGEHPVLIDCECFFHPETALPAGATMESRDSLFRTGMFLRADIDWPLARLTGAEMRRRRRDVIRGFETMHDLLSSASLKRRFNAVVGRWRRLPVRYIYRSTAHYLSVLQRSLEAEVLKKHTARSRLLYSSLEDKLCSSGTVRREVAQLLAGDIPVFCGPAALHRSAMTEAEFSKALDELSLP